MLGTFEQAWLQNEPEDYVSLKPSGCCSQLSHSAMVSLFLLYKIHAAKLMNAVTTLILTWIGRLMLYYQTTPKSQLFNLTKVYFCLSQSVLLVQVILQGRLYDLALLPFQHILPR